MKWELEGCNKSSSFRDAYANTLMELTDADEKVAVLEADLMGSSGSGKVFAKHPNQCVNFGISEANMISAAGGMSKAGLIPFAHSFAPFITRRVLDQFYMSIAYSDNSLFIYSSDAGIWSQRSGGTHTANEDMAVMSSIPKTMVFDPCDPIQFQWLMKEYYRTRGIYYVRAGRKAEIPHIYSAGSTFETGRGNVIHEGKSRVAIVACGMMVHEALKAYRSLKEKNIDVSVIDMFSIKPYDSNLLQKVIKENDIILAAENHTKTGGLGAIVAYEIAKSKCSPVFKHIGIPIDAFGEVGSLDYLKAKFKLRAEDIENAVLEEIK